MKQVLLFDGIPENAIALVPSGIDFSRFQEVHPRSKKELGLEEDHILIGQVAALEDHKDQDTFIRALAILQKKAPRVRAVIVGDGSLEKPLKTLARDLGVSPILQFLGFRLDPLNYLAAFDIFCLSSKLEGLGTSILDAMALRIPVAATRTGGIPELVEDLKTGFLSAPRDPSGLAETMLKAIEQGIGNTSLLDRASEKAKTYDIIHTIEKTEAVYHSLLKTA